VGAGTAGLAILWLAARLEEHWAAQGAFQAAQEAGHAARAHVHRCVVFLLADATAGRVVAALGQHGLGQSRRVVMYILMVCSSEQPATRNGAEGGGGAACMLFLCCGDFTKYCRCISRAPTLAHRIVHRQRSAQQQKKTFLACFDRHHLRWCERTARQREEHQHGQASARHSM
jgi:hypothetical protein